MAAQTEKLELDLAVDGGRFIVRGIDEALSFASDELSFWSWVPNGGPPYVSERITSILGPLRSFVANGSVNSDDWQDQFRHACVTVFVDAKLPLKKSRLGVFFGSLAGDSVEAALAAISHHLTVSGLQLDRAEHVRGVVAYSLFKEGISPRLPAAVEKQLSHAVESYSQNTVRAQNEVDEQLEKVRRERQEVRDLVAKSIRSARRNFARTSLRLQKSALGAVGEIDQTRRTYEEFMNLKAPVQYWEDKAKKHRKSSDSYASSLLIYSVFSFIFLGLGLYNLADHLVQIATSDKPPAVYFVLVSVGIVLTTIIFWVARILTRLFLSQHHLAIDAEERAVMVQTYLAMTATNVASTDERAIVLSSLFRPTADGIVKDDGAPDLGPSALLSRLVQR